MITCKIKQWGNSLGLILPRDIVREKNIKPEEEIIINIEKKRSILKELFGALCFKKATKILLEESRRNLESKFS